MKSAYESFQDELNRLVAAFEKGFQAFTAPDYSEARCREDFLNPLFRALGWDLANRRGLVQSQREVEIESRTDVAGRAKRADYLFRADGRERFVCEAKKPREVLGDRYAFQAKRYAWNKGLPLAVLTDFEDLKVYVVGGRPRPDRPDDGLWKTWNFRQFPLCAREIWDLLSRERVVAGGIEALLDSLPRAKPVKGKARQPWLIRPERTKALDQDFLEYLDEQRLSLARDILANNTREDLLAEGRLNEAVQHILDRLLFLRICEDRDIDTGLRLAKIVETWRRAYGHEDRRRPKQGHFFREESAAYRAAPPPDSLWAAVVGHLQALDRRPPGNMPHFNGNLFKPHFSEALRVGDQWLCDFIEDLSDDESPYLFNVIPVEILGSVYERFLGKVIRPSGRGVAADEKPEVRKAGGVYYTPRYIVDYIVEQTVGKQLDDIAGGEKTYAAFDKKTRALKILDPACGSGSFLLRAFERVGEHYQRRLTEQAGDRKPDRCWTDPATGDVHLTVDLKRQILRNNIFGVDLDAQAVEVTQLSLYLKMLEGEDRATIKQQRELFRDDTALLPPLEDNIKHGNSLIASDFSLVPDDLTRVHAFDWDIQFADIMKAGGFDAVIGNPPYILLQDDFRDDQQLEYFRRTYEGASFKLDTYHLFIERGIRLCRKSGRISFITPSNFLTNNHLDGLRRVILKATQPEEIVVVEGGVFSGVSVDNAVFVFRGDGPAVAPFPMTRAVAEGKGLKPTGEGKVEPRRVMAESRALFTSGIHTPDSELWDRLSSRFPQLGSFADVNFGKQLRDRSKFTNDVIEVAGPRSIPRTHVACVTGKDVERYLLTWSKLACLNDTIAQSGGCWDESKHKAKGKLLTRQIGQFPTFAMDPSGYHCLNTIFMVTLRDGAAIKPAFLLGILNSKLLRRLWVGRFYDQRKTFPKIKGTYLKELPIAVSALSSPSDLARHDKLVELVDKMLALVPKLRSEASESKRKTLQNAVDATDRQIDRLVYELYGLTEEEIALVEGQGG
ncbi:MAG: N-6 DNA methylase [Kiritimatiellae bacterium]|nr:N-6 DNA methylase [Kiritimatiellia bacterium]